MSRRRDGELLHYVVESIHSSKADSSNCYYQLLKQLVPMDDDILIDV